MPRRSKLTTPLTVRAEKFVANYLGGMTGTEAARAAGYAKPDSAGHRLLMHPKIKSLVADARAKIRNAGVYKLEQAIADADRIARVAEAKGQFMAAVRAREHQSRLAGLLTDKLEIQGAPLAINIIGLAVPNSQERPAIDVPVTRHLTIEVEGD